jgi:cytochrome c553
MMRRLRLRTALPATLTLAAFMTGTAHAQTSAPHQGINAPAAAASCMGCHGALGAGDLQGGWPRLAGLPAEYMTAQLNAFADGSRHSDLMTQAAQALTPAERQSVAQYFSVQSAPTHAPPGIGPMRDDTPGAWLANRGRWADKIPACAECHGADGLGVGERFPPIAGLPAWYFRAQLQAWKAQQRPAGPMGLMGQIAARLSDRDIDALTRYYAAPRVVPTLTASPAADSTEKHDAH